MFAVQLQTKAARQAADDARVTAARAALTVHRIDALPEAPAAPAPILTLAQIEARNAAREVGAPVVEPTAPTLAVTPGVTFKCRWNGAPAPDIYRAPRRPVTKRSGVSSSPMQSCATTRVYFSRG